MEVRVYTGVWNWRLRPMSTWLYGIAMSLDEILVLLFARNA
jgi:hypothetical protein